MFTISFELHHLSSFTPRLFDQLFYNVLLANPNHIHNSIILCEFKKHLVKKSGNAQTNEVMNATADRNIYFLISVWKVRSYADTVSRSHRIIIFLIKSNSRILLKILSKLIVCLSYPQNILTQKLFCLCYPHFFNLPCPCFIMLVYQYFLQFFCNSFLSLFIIVILRCFPQILLNYTVDIQVNY